MIIVAGHLIVSERDAYLRDCEQIVVAARSAPGCLDFALSADLLDVRRVNVFERWESTAAVEAFRGSGPGETQQEAIASASVVEYDVTGERDLTG